MQIKGGKIRQLREERNCSLAEFASKAGISISYLSEIERGAKKPSIRTIDKIATALNVSKNQLIEITSESRGVSLGDKIRLLREQADWTLAELAKKAEVSISFLSEIERSNTYPAIHTLKRIADALDADLQDLIGRGGILGSKLRMLREEQGLTQGELAGQAGVSGGLIGQIEQGKVQPSLQTVERVSEALGVSPCYFLIDDAGVEDLLKNMSPELRELLNEENVQGILRLICNCSPKEMRFILDFIKLYKKHGSTYFK